VACAKTYPIAEPDFLSEVHRRAEWYIHNQWQQDRERLLEKIKHYKPEKLIHLKPAPKDYSYTVKLTYTLPYDIPRVDKQGRVVGILYPKGYTFNPLDYISADPPTLVIFNGCRKAEVEWVKRHWLNRANVMLLITDGDWFALDNELKRPVFFLPPVIAEKLRLKHTAAVVYRDSDNKSLLRVEVYSIASAKGKRPKAKGKKTLKKKEKIR